MRNSERSALMLFAVAAILPCGPTRIGSMSPSEAASSVAPSEVASQGCATATFNRGRAFAVARSRLYFSRLRVSTNTGCDTFEATTTSSSSLSTTVSALGRSALRALGVDRSDCRFSAGHVVGVRDVPGRPDKDWYDLAALIVSNQLTVH